MLCLSLTGCSSQMLKSFGELAKLRQLLMERYHENDVRVTVHNSDNLSIAFVNSSLNSSNWRERAKRAYETAVVARNNYSAIKQLNSIWISFVKYETKYVFFHLTETLDAFGFDKNGRSLSEYGRNSPEFSDEFHPVVQYSKARDQTDVSIMRIQLAGNTNRGIAMVPHFAVKGDATSSDTKLSPPRSVVLDFAAYSASKLFSGNPSLEINCDGKIIFAGKARLLSASEQNGTAMEFLSREISYSQFRQMTDAAWVSIHLDSREYKLSQTQMGALREMRRYAGE